MATPDPALQAMQSARSALQDAIQLAERQASGVSEDIARAKAEVTAMDRTLAAGESTAEARAAAVERSAEAVQSSCQLLQAAGLPPRVGSPLDEWKECRATIDRCDKILVDLRKTGFGFLTAAVGAAAFLFKGDESFDHKAPLLVMLVLLIVTLYLIDLAHQTWLGVAVGRAKDLEDMMGFALTNRISTQFGAGRALLLGFFLYFIMLAATSALFWFSAPTAPLTSGPHVTVYYAFFIGLLAMGIGALDASQWGQTRKLQCATRMTGLRGRLGIATTKLRTHLKDYVAI
jgi:hypothetical protein